MSGTGDWSVSIWLYHTGGTTGNDGLYSSNGSAELLYFQGATQKIKASSGGTAITPSSTIAQSTWYHVVYTRSSGSGTLYINGASVGTGSDTTDMPSGTEWRVGHAYSGEVWAGSACEFAVWNGRVLSLSEVQSIYNSGSGKKIPDALGSGYDTSLTGYYPMDTNFNKSAGTGGTNGVISGSATVDNASPATPIPAADEKATLLTTFSDSLGTSADGTAISDPTFVASGDTNGVAMPSGFGSGAKSMYFDGNDAINIDGAKPFSTTVGSISLWFYNNGTSNEKAVLFFGDTDAGSYLGIETRTDGIWAKFRQASGTTAQWEIRACPSCDNNITLDDDWHHLVLSQDGTAVKVYVDNVLLTTFGGETDKSKWVESNLDNGRIGCNSISGNGNANFFTGNLMEIGLWNVALTSQQVSSLFGNGGSTAKKANTEPTGLKVYYDGSSLTNNLADYSDLPENTLFEETDTQSTWWLQSSKWKGTNQPLEISDLWAWWKAESQYMTLNSSGVTVWNPQINTTPKKLIADSAGVEPTFEANGRNGRGIVKFDGTEVMHTNDDSYRLTQPLTFVIVMKFPTAVDDKTIFDADNTGNRLLHRNTGTAGTQLELNNGTTFTSDATTQFSASWGYEVLVFNGSSSKWRINGVDVAPSTFNPSDDFNPITIASDYRALNGGSNNAVMDIMHFIIYDKALSDSEITDIEEWCASEVGT